MLWADEVGVRALIRAVGWEASPQVAAEYVIMRRAAILMLSGA
jgi:hypothetical protein